MERKLKRFNILLDDESLLYFPGSFLTGKVLLELEENTPASGLYFHIVGEGVVRLGRGRQKKSLASERENYIDFKMRLLGEDSEPDVGTVASKSGVGSDSDSVISSSSSSLDPQRATKSKRREAKSSRRVANSSSASSSDSTSTGRDSRRRKVMILSPGVHTFPFKLGLPPNLPSTFLGLHGWVQYFCRGVLKEPSGLIHKNQQVFIIINPIDLNNEPLSLQQPFYCEAEERINASSMCLLKSGGSIGCRVRLDRGAFVPGENILLSANIENESRTSIRKTRAVLTETVEYRAKNKLIQSETRELASLERGKVAPQCKETWKNEALHIPALPPTNLRGCQLIKIHYDVYFQIFTKSAKKPIQLQLPIVMATYPIRNKDGTLKRRKGASYPQNLPIFRPWMEQGAHK